MIIPPFLGSILLNKYVIAGAIALAVVTGSYVKGKIDGRTAYKAKIEREIADAIRKGDAAREKALRDFDALPDDSLPDDGFRRQER